MQKSIYNFRNCLIHIKINIHLKCTVAQINLKYRFKKGDLLISLIKNVQIKREPKKFLVLNNIQELFDELKENKRLQISDQNCLIIPIEVIYKNRASQLVIQLPLVHQQMKNEAQKVQMLLQSIEKLNQTIKKQTSYDGLIQFRGDRTNQNFNFFQQSQNGKIVKKIGYKYMAFNHYKPLKRKSVSYFKIRILVIKYRQIIVGVCGDNIKSFNKEKLVTSPYFMGLLFYDETIYPKKQKVKIKKIEKGSVFKVVVDLINNVISWFQNDELVCCIQISAQLKAVKIYPVVVMESEGDTVEFLNQ